MKKSLRFTLFTVAVLAAYVLSACGAPAPAAAPAAPQSSSSNPSVADAPTVLAVEVAFSGMVEAMNGSQWVVDGKTINVDPQTVAGGVQIGDMVRVEGTVGQDGAITSTRVQNSAAAAAGEPGATSTPDPSTGGGQEVFGVIEAMTDTTITIGGVVYQLTNFSEVKGLLSVGDEVKIHFVTNPDGTLTIREIELRSTTGDDNSNGNGNANENGNANDNGSDDNGNGNGSDDNSNGNGSDDNGNGNGSDDNGNDNGSDDNGNDNGSDDNGNDNGSDDNGNGSDDNGNGNGSDDNGNGNGSDDNGNGNGSSG